MENECKNCKTRLNELSCPPCCARLGNELLDTNNKITLLKDLIFSYKTGQKRTLETFHELARILRCKSNEYVVDAARRRMKQISDLQKELRKK